MGFVLGQDDNPVDFRVDAVTQGEIDESIDPTKGNGRFGAVASERHESLTLPTSHHKCQSLFHLLLLVTLLKKV